MKVWVFLVVLLGFSTSLLVHPLSKIESCEVRPIMETSLEKKSLGPPLQELPGDGHCGDREAEFAENTQEASTPETSPRPVEERPIDSCVEFLRKNVFASSETEFPWLVPEPRPIYEYYYGVVGRWEYTEIRKGHFDSKLIEILGKENMASSGFATWISNPFREENRGFESGIVVYTWNPISVAQIEAIEQTISNYLR